MAADKSAGRRPSPRGPGRAVTPKGAETRDRILSATADLLRHKGYTGTGLKEIVEASKAPFGSVYHYFPGGKEELGAEAVREAGNVYLALVAAFFDGAEDFVEATAAFFAGAAEVLRQTDYEDACPIATVALEVASTSEPLRKATAEVFESWIDDLVQRVTARGIDPERAREVSVFALAALEGAFVLSRASKSTEAVEVAGRHVVAAVRDLLAEGA